MGQFFFLFFFLTCRHWVGCGQCVISVMTTTCCHQLRKWKSTLSVRCPKAALMRVFFSWKMTFVLLSSFDSKCGELIHVFIFWKTAVGWYPLQAYSSVLCDLMKTLCEFVSCCGFQDWKRVGQEDNLVTFVARVSDHGGGLHKSLNRCHVVGAVFASGNVCWLYLSFWEPDIHSCSPAGHGVCCRSIGVFIEPCCFYSGLKSTATWGNLTEPL